MMIRLVTVGVLVMISIVLADPTMYKKNEQNLYEPGTFVNGDHVKLIDIESGEIVRDTMEELFWGLKYFELLEWSEIFKILSCNQLMS